MKKIFSTLLTAIAIAMLAAGCGNGQSFTILGKVSTHDLDGCPIRLYALDNGDSLAAATIQDGQFRIAGKLEKTMMGLLVAENKETGMAAQSVLVLEKGKIHINIYNDSLHGTPLNDLLFSSYTADSVMQVHHALLEQAFNQYMSAASQPARDAALAKYNETDSIATLHRLEISRSLFRSNMDNVLGAYALSQIVEVDGISYDSLDYYMTHSGPIFADYEPLRKARTRLFHIENTSAGKKFVDFEGIDFSTGKGSRLSAMVKEGDITIIDFWASWCSPCRQEISENLIRLYDKYHKKGVNIIGIDVWDKTEDHAAAVKKLGIRYPQIVDTTRSTATDLYGVEGVPTILLIGPDGTILHRDIRGAEIEQAIVKELEVKNTKK